MAIEMRGPGLVVRGGGRSSEWKAALVPSLVVWSVLASGVPPADGQEEAAALRRIEGALAPVLEGLVPPARIEHRDGSRSLEVTHRPRLFRVHPLRSKTGERSPEAVEVEGPAHDGFILRVHLQPVGELNQALVPQTIREPYWSTDLDVVPIAGTPYQAYWALSHAGRSDAAVLEGLREALRALGDSGKKAPGGVRPSPGTAAEGAGPPPENDSPASAPVEAGEQLSVLEGTLRRHPKFLYSWYLDGFGGGQSCALDPASRLAGLEVGSRIRVEGRIGTRHHDGGNATNPSPFPRTWFIFMDVDAVTVLDGPPEQSAIPAEPPPPRQ